MVFFGQDRNFVVRTVIYRHFSRTTRLETAIPALLRRLKTFPDKDNLSIVFPDEGAQKRFQAQFEGYPIITCIKQRQDGAGRIVKIKEGYSFCL